MAQSPTRQQRGSAAAGNDPQLGLECGAGADIDGRSMPTTTAGADTDLPWVDADRRYKRTVMLKIPEHEFFMLKWLAGTTYEGSQQGIALAAVRAEIKRRMAERGIVVEEGEDGALEVARERSG